MDRWVSTFYLRRSRAHKLIQKPLPAESKKQNLKSLQDSWVQQLPLTRFLGSAESLVSFLGLLQSDLSRGGLLSRVRLGRSRVWSTRAMWHLRGARISGGALGVWRGAPSQFSLQRSPREAYIHLYLTKPAHPDPREKSNSVVIERSVRRITSDLLCPVR